MEGSRKDFGMKWELMVGAELGSSVARVACGGWGRQVGSYRSTQGTGMAQTSGSDC